MAREDYARWIVENQDKAGTPEFETVAAAYKASRDLPKDDSAAFPKAAGRAVLNAAAGALRGAGSIGATLLTPYDLVTGNTRSIGNPERRKAMTDALRNMGADTDGLAFGVGKLGAEVAGTLGVGGALAKGGAMLPSRAAPLVDAVRSAGFSAGGATGLGGAAVRAAGGAITGGASAGLVNPDDLATGAAVGAVLPGAVQLAGAGGRAAGELFKSTKARASDRLVKALEADAAAAAQLKAAREFVPGSAPTVAQVLRTPQAGILERVVGDSPGGAALKARYAEQNAARLAALDGVAPVDPRGFRSAQQDFGAAALDAVRKGDAAAKARTSAAYQAVPLDEASIYLPELAPIRDQYFPAGAFGGRAAVDEAVNTAERIGTINVPGIMPTRGARVQGATLSQAIRGMGGISIQNNSGLRGEVSALRGELKNLVRQNGGRSPADVAEAMHEAGYISSPSTQELFDALRAEARGEFSYGMNAGIDDYARAQAERAMGDAPGPQQLPGKVSLRSVDALRKSIGNAQRAAAKDPERATEALALGKMKEAIDGRIDEVVRGDGAADEVLPIDWANALTDAQALKRAQVAKYRTGPQAGAFDRGADGLPKLQGGEFAAKVWGNRPGIADDIKQFRAVMDDHPQLLGQFRSMVTTEGAGTATASGDLSAKFVRWVENALPGLKASFEPDQVKTLQRIAADIKRATAGASAGMSRGSNTYQNAANALSLGLLDSPMLNAAANRVPIANALTGPGLQWLRETSRERLAREMAGLLSDPAGAADALLAAGRAPTAGLLSPSLLRPVPVLAGDR